MTRGLGAPATIAIIAVAFVVAGAAYYNLRPEGEIMMNKGQEMMEEGEKMMEEGEDMMHDGEAMMEEGEKMMDDDGVMMETADAKGSGESSGSYKGEVLAGNVDGAVLLDFHKEDYDKAIASDKLVVLYFFANWCPICKVEVATALYPAFNQLTDENVIGIRINYNDNQTDSDERDLARQFGVAYQHTKVFVKNGERILKSPDGWDKDRYITEINNTLN